ncbi:exopolysaccharide production repressor protein [Rhizobium leguminosarum]|uniref:exopolysaccharide production repressor protein n=1 Tax=Rhizobium leguminosarum TaxID=384 RepID=UPI003965770F
MCTTAEVVYLASRSLREMIVTTLAVLILLQLAYFGHILSCMPKLTRLAVLYKDPMTCHCEFPPGWIRVRPIKGRTNEEAEIYGRADYCSAEGAGGRREGGRPLPQARDFRSDVL